MATRKKNRGAPSQKADDREKEHTQQRSLEERRRSQLYEDMQSTFGTAHGKRVLAWLANESGWGQSVVSAVADARGVLHIDANATLYKAQEQAVYIRLRRLVPKAILKQVEYGDIKPSGQIEE